MDVPIIKRVIELAQKYGKDIYGVVSNMSIAMERRDLLKDLSCVVCNVQEASLLFSEDYEEKSAEELAQIMSKRIEHARIPRMIVTMGSSGAVYASATEGCGICPPQKVDVIDTTGAGDSFFAGVAIGLTYGKNIQEACAIGTRLASSVIATKENVCPRFLPEEFDLVLPEE